MQLRTVIVIGKFCVALSLGATPIAGAADVDKGLAAAESSDYATALQEFQPLAEQGNASAQFNLGFMYATGQGAPQDNAQAHMWFNLAASQGGKHAADGRGTIAKHMTSQQISEA